MNFEKEKLRKFTTAYRRKKKSRSKFNQERYIKENINELKDIPGSWAGRIKAVKTGTLLCTTDLMQLLSKLQCQFSEK